ncbi:MAG: hypothetical protein PUK59_04660 [Actinomycetaceae bacterium]|nr:hypothetical protein [Actinomycetaceae bacterium]MDY5273634.1 hypothetical protein [Arcanobacterium sp.]
MTTTLTHIDIDPNEAYAICSRFLTVTMNATQAFTNSILTASLDERLRLLTQAINALNEIEAWVHLLRPLFTNTRDSLDDTMKNGLTNTHTQDDKGQEAPHGEA